MINEFEELLTNRRRELDKHLAFIRELENSALNRTGGAPVDTEHVNILKSAFLVHLYNVVESVMTKTVDEIAAAAEVHPPANWADGLFRSWLEHRANAVVDLAASKRVDRIVSVIAEAAGRQPLESARVAKREGGNWSHDQIANIAGRLSCTLTIRPDVEFSACTRNFLNAMPPMKYVRHMRNQLAHGNVSFIDAGSLLSVAQLDSLRVAILDYMEDVTASFRAFLDEKKYLGENA